MSNPYEISPEAAIAISNWLSEGAKLNRAPFRVNDVVVALESLGIGTQQLSIIETIEVPQESRAAVGSAQWVRVRDEELGMVWDSGKKQWVSEGNKSEVEKIHPTKFGSNWFNKIKS